MTRNRASAKKAGTTFERTIANYLNTHVDNRIDRQIKTGVKDVGDIAGIRIWGQKIVAECKNVRTPALPQWAREADIERGNADALAGLIIHKRHGVSAPEKQWVTMTLAELVALLNGNRDHTEDGQ
ncbi:hypothetical protein [Trueperella pyogenes]